MNNYNCVMIIEQITTLLTQYITFFYPIDDVNLKITFSIAISSIISSVLYFFWDTIKNFKFTRQRIKEKYIIIEKHNKLYNEFINYLYNKFKQETKGCKIDSKNDTFQFMIDEILKNEFLDNHNGNTIRIGFIKDIKEDNNNKKDKNNTDITTKDIILKTDDNINILEDYLKMIIKLVNSNENEKINIYKLKVTNAKKNKSITWSKSHFITNKTIENTIISNEVKKLYLDDIKRFIDNEPYYLKKGLPYKRGYLLHGEPGCGKTSLIKAVSHDMNIPIFILDLNILTNNAELIAILNEINYYINDKQKYFLVFEDFDRTNLFKANNDYDQNNRKSNKITEDCILNILDGIDESYGRIVVITTNSLNKIKSIKSLIRPGRIDSLVYVTFCNMDQIKRILIFYFDLADDVEIKLAENIIITPAQLIQIIYLILDYENVLLLINKIINFTNCNIEQEIFNFEKISKTTETNISFDDNVSINYKKKMKIIPRSRSRRNNNKHQRQIINFKRSVSKLNSTIKKRNAKIPIMQSNLENKERLEIKKLEIESQKIRQNIDIIKKNNLMNKLQQLREINGKKKSSKKISKKCTENETNNITKFITKYKYGIINIPNTCIHKLVNFDDNFENIDLD